MTRRAFIVAIVGAGTLQMPVREVTIRREPDGCFSVYVTDAGTWTGATYATPDEAIRAARLLLVADRV